MDARILSHTREVEKPKTVNDHCWCTRPKVEWFLCGSKMTNRKNWWLEKDAVIGQLGVVSHCLQ